VETPAPAAAPDVTAVPPDWGSIPEQVSCPLCEYDLRGLEEPRCPECGYRFDWPDLLDPTRRRHRYLFEHHPERNVWSFLKTATGGLRPGRFWRSLLPVQRSSPRRLAVYAGVVLLVVFVLGPVTTRLQTATFLLQYGMAPSWGVALDLAGDVRSASFLLPAYGCFVLWAVTTFLALLVFRVSMLRARIRPVHVARCVVYSFDAAFWLAVVVCAACMLTLAAFVVLSRNDFAFMFLAVDLAPWLLVPVIIYRLVMAYRHYLRFDRPFLTVLASQVIAGLVVLNAIVLVANLTT
jgi:hypothetical protein